MDIAHGSLLLLSPDPTSVIIAVLTAILVVLAVVPLIVSRVRVRKRLAYEEVSDASIINNETDLGEGILVMVDDQPVNNPRLKVVRLLNSGSLPIGPNDFAPDSPLSIQFQSRSIIRCAVHALDPPNLIPRNRWKDLLVLDGGTGTDPDEQQQDGPKLHISVELPKLLFNPGQSVTLKFVTLGRTAFDVFGTLKAGDIRKYVPPRRLVTRQTVGYGIALVLGGAILGGLVLPRAWTTVVSYIQGNCAFGTLSLGSSTAFAHTMDARIAAYRSSCPIAALANHATASRETMRMLENGTVQVASSELSPPEANCCGDLVDTPVAVIVFAMIVNGDLGDVHALSRDQITGIYAGTITNWSQVGGPDLAIRTIGRPSDSGTYAAFDRFVLTHPAKAGQDLSDTDAVVNAVATTRGAIGYVDAGSAYRARGVDILGIGSQTATVGHVGSGDYQFWAVEHLYTKGEPDQLSRSFIGFVSTGISTGDTFVALSDMSKTVLDGHDCTSSPCVPT